MIARDVSDRLLVLTASPEATQKLLNVIPSGYSKDLIGIIASLLSVDVRKNSTCNPYQSTFQTALL